MAFYSAVATTGPVLLLAGLVQFRQFVTLAATYERAPERVKVALWIGGYLLFVLFTLGLTAVELAALWCLAVGGGSPAIQARLAFGIGAALLLLIFMGVTALSLTPAWRAIAPPKFANVENARTAVILMGMLAITLVGGLVYFAFALDMALAA